MNAYLKPNRKINDGTRLKTNQNVTKIKKIYSQPKIKLIEGDAKVAEQIRGTT